jgi:hypothetical protein
VCKRIKERARKAKVASEEARLAWEKERLEQEQSHSLALALINSNKSVAGIEEVLCLIKYKQ